MDMLSGKHTRPFHCGLSAFVLLAFFSAFTLLAFLPQHGFSLSGANGVLAPKSMKTAFRAAIQLGFLPFILILV